MFFFDVQASALPLVPTPLARDNYKQTATIMGKWRRPIKVVGESSTDPWFNRLLYNGNPPYAIQQNLYLW